MINALLASALISSLSIIGILFLGKSGHLKGSHRFIIPIAMGVFLGVVFFELIPETLAAGDKGAIAIIIGFLSFYLLSHILRTYHHHHHDHDDGCTHQTGATKLLIGDTIHNMADGVVIASAFLVNPGVGIATTIGIALHEIPQEIAEFGVLITAGYSKRKALLLNFLSATSIFVGVIISFIFLVAGDYLWILTGLAAGNLLYIAASDMIPELNQSSHHHHFWQTFLSTLVGIVAIISILSLTH